MDFNCFQDLSLTLDGICNFLKGNNRDVHELVLQYILLMTGDLHRSRDIYTNKAILKELLNIASCNNDNIGQIALNSIINITGSEDGAHAVLDAGSTQHEVISIIIGIVLDTNSTLVDHACKVLANITIPERLSCKISNIIIEHDNLFKQIVSALCNSQLYNQKGYKMDHLAQFIGNLGQSIEFQEHILHVECDKFVSLLPIVHYGESFFKRKGIAALIYNCLFDSKNHSVLLNEPFNILPIILYPLAGPEEFDESDYDSMPIELQYLPEDKQREVDPDIRKILLKSLLLLCATKSGRIFLRDNQTYLFLREYHKWEEDRSNLLNCENVIDILIRTEEEIGVDDLKSLQVPDDLQEKFEKWDLDYVNND